MGGILELTYKMWLTDIGPLTAMATEKGLAALFLRPRDPDEGALILSSRKKYKLIEDESVHIKSAIEQVDAYLARELTEFDLELDYWGTDFQMSVWNNLKTVPYGKVLSYKDLAIMTGSPKGYRAVGSAVGKNPLPIIIPCHRVVASNGIGGFSSGLARKTILLGIEGVTEADLNSARCD